MRILCGVDLRTEGHDWVVDRLVAWSQAMNHGTVDLLFVTADGEERAPRIRALDQLLERFPEDRRGRSLTRGGSPVDVLVSESTHYDVLVVGPREPGAIERMFLGSMASRVIRHARCAVFVPRGEHRDTDAPRHLVGVDLRRDGAHLAVSQAARWARLLRARLDLTFVEPDRLPYIADSRVRAKAEAEWRAARKPDLELLQDLLTALELEHRGHAFLCEGQPEDALVDLSDRYQLLMVGNRERPGLAGYILGSIAEHVVRRSACDVLTLPTGAPPPLPETEEPAES